MKKRTAICAIFALSLLLSFAGCGKAAPASVGVSGQSSVSVPETAEPEKALEEIYKAIDTMGIEEGSRRVLKDKFNISTDLLDDYYFQYTNGRFGVADVFILDPSDGESSKVREALEQVKLSRAKEFENYDIHNAHQIAQDAPIFEQGEYVIMLMLEDSETAREVIDKYIPKE